MHVFSGSPVRVRRTEPCTRRSGLPQSPQPPLSSPRSAAAAAAAAAVVEGEQLSDKITRLADRQAARIVRGAWSQAGEATREALALRRAALLGQGEQPPRRGGKQRSKPPADALQPEAATWEPLY
ncbi:hypothetical protein DIPPA_34478 [Diplonema papillatum]|nr:hypothetical protein DIPPA_34478 [Diplonema papillatum]